MPGVALSITLPTVGVTAGPTYATDINSALQTIIDDIEAKIVPSELNMNAALDMGNQDIDDVNSMKVDNQASAALSGAGNARRVNAFGGELYFCDGSGNSVKITDSGILAGVSGDIGGDYGDGSEEITYTAATNTYTFTDDATNKAIIDAGEYLHEEYELTIHPAAGIGKTANWVLDNTTSDVTIVNPGAADYWSVSIPLKVGDRILSVEMDIDAAQNTTVTLYETGAGAHSSKGSVGPFTTTGTETKEITSINHTLLTNKCYNLTAAVSAHGATTYQISRIAVHYDRP